MHAGFELRVCCGCCVLEGCTVLLVKESQKIESLFSSHNLLIVQRHCECGRNLAEAAAISAAKAATDFPLRVSFLHIGG